MGQSQRHTSTAPNKNAGNGEPPHRTVPAPRLVASACARTRRKRKSEMVNEMRTKLTHAQLDVDAEGPRRLKRNKNE